MMKINLKNNENKNLKDEIYGRLNKGKSSSYSINTDTIVGKYNNIIG